MLRIPMLLGLLALLLAVPSCCGTWWAWGCDTCCWTVCDAFGCWDECDPYCDGYWKQQTVLSDAAAGPVADPGADPVW